MKNESYDASGMSSTSKYNRKIRPIKQQTGITRNCASQKQDG